MASRSIHALTQAVLSRKNMRFVGEDPAGTRFTSPDDNAVAFAISDPDNGVFSLSEIAFDTEHHRAIVSHSFNCGMLCGSGRTLVFEKVGDEWKPTNLECGGWVS